MTTLGWDALEALVDCVQNRIPTHGQLLCRLAAPPVGEQMQEVLLAALSGRTALDRVEPASCYDVLKALIDALEPRLVGGQALRALHAAVQEPTITVQVAGTIHSVLTSTLPAEEAKLLRRLLQLLVAAVRLELTAMG